MSNHSFIDRLSCNMYRLKNVKRLKAYGVAYYVREIVEGLRHYALYHAKADTGASQTEIC